MDTRTKLRKRTKSLKRKKLVVGLSLTTLGLGIIAPVAISSLNPTVVSAATVSEINLSGASAAVNLYDSLVQSDYTEDSWSAMSSGLITPDGGVNSLDALRWWLSLDVDYDFGGSASTAQNTVDTFTNRLNYAIGLLVLKDAKPPVDTLNLDALRAAIQSSENLVETDYTTESWEVFNQALINATFVEAYVTNGETVPYTYTQADIDGFSNNLVNAINGLVEVTPGWEISELRTAYERYAALNEADYTPESWSQMYNDLNGVNNPVHLIYVAESVLNGTFSQDALTQDDINDIVSRINTAIDSLVAEAVEPQTGTYGVAGYAILPGDDFQTQIYLKEKTATYGTSVIENAPVIDGYKLWLNFGSGHSNPFIEFEMNEDSNGRGLIFNYVPEESAASLDISKAQKTLNTYDNLVENDYTTESWSVLQQEINNNEINWISGLRGIVNGSVTTSQDNVDLAVQTVNDAIEKLVLQDNVKTVTGGKITASSSTVKVGEPITLTYTISFSDGTTEEFNNFTVYKKGHSGDTSPIAIIDNGSWTPTEAGDYQLYGISPYGLYDDIIITVTEDTDSENPTNPSEDNTSNNGDINSSTTPIEKDDKTTDNNNNEVTVSKNENNKETISETNSSKDTNSSKQNKEKDKTADELPKTGEHSSLTLGFSGFGVILLALITWFKKRRKA